MNFALKNKELFQIKLALLREATNLNDNLSKQNQKLQLISNINKYLSR